MSIPWTHASHEIDERLYDALAEAEVSKADTVTVRTADLRLYQKELAVLFRRAVAQDRRISELEQAAKLEKVN